MTSPKVVGIGLNKTGTKTLGYYLKQWGFRHKTYDLDAFNLYRAGHISELLELMGQYDSFEDWPWPLMFREIDHHFPDARFILTVRSSSDIWYRSLCNMAVRMGPFNRFEKHIYGYAMPQGHREEHLKFYEAHNQAVEAYFEDRPSKLLKICWETGDNAKTVADFLGLEVGEIPPKHVNRSSRAVYTGDNLHIAQVYRVAYQSWRHALGQVHRIAGAIRRRLLPLK